MENEYTREQFVSTFNSNGKKKGLAYLRSVGIVRAYDVAGELYDLREKLDPVELGQCLGHHGAAYQAILREYPLRFDLRQSSFVGALRKFLWSFRLPGESLQIDRIMQAFAHAYMTQHGPACAPVSSRSWETDKDDAGANTKDQEQHDRQLTTAHKSLCPVPESFGWYVQDAFDTGAGEAACCIDCGTTEHADPAVSADTGSVLYTCRGCGCVTFCRRCGKFASRRGHAIVGRIGYGRACMAALQRRGSLEAAAVVTYSGDGKLGVREEAVDDAKVGMALSWTGAAGAGTRACPFVDEDAAFVFAFSVIMLTTNLHNPSCKTKMTKQEFLATNRGTNGGGNLPGDFVAMVYDDIKGEEIRFQGQHPQQ